MKRRKVEENMKSKRGGGGVFRQRFIGDQPWEGTWSVFLSDLAENTYVGPVGATNTENHL